MTASSSAAVGGRGIRGVFEIRDMRLLLIGFTTSRTGDFLYSVALVVFIAESTGSAAWVGAVSLVRLLPFALISPLAGVVGDRFPARRLLVACDLSQATAMLALAAVVAADGSPYLILLIVGVSTILGAPYFPVLTSLTPRLVAEQQLAATNTFISTVENLALIVGPALGGLLLVLGPPALPIALNAVTFLASAAFTAAISFSGRPGELDDGSPAESQSFLAELAEGLRATLSDRVVAVLVLFTSAVTFVYGFELVYLVFVAKDRLGLGAAGVGYLNASIGLGGALGAFLTARLASSPRVRLVMIVTLLGCGVPLGLLAVITAPWLAYLALAIEGVASIALDVVVITALQRVVRTGLLGRVTSIMDSLTMTAILLGNIAAVALLSATSLTVSLVVAGSILPLLTVALLPALGDLEKRADTRRLELDPVVAVLTASRLLEGASAPVVERLATMAVREVFPAGTVVVREGDEADDVFVLADGRTDVSVDGAHVNTVEAPGYFGEIGLVHRRARTASVTAVTDCVVYRLPGGEFLAAVSGSIPVALQTEMAVRLDRSGQLRGRS